MADVTRSRCTCMQCRMRVAIGPLMLIAIGIVFLIAEYSRYSFADLWPTLLILWGLLSIGQALASRQGHTGS